MTTTEFTPVTVLGRSVLEVASEAICLVFTKFVLKSLSYKMLNSLVVTAAHFIITSQAYDSLTGLFLCSADQEMPHIHLNSYKKIRT
jgi:hypothetical protein